MLTTPLRLAFGAVFGAALLAIGAPFAYAQTTHHGSGHHGGGSVPGNNGTVDVHSAGTPSGRPCNQSKVCKFDLVGRGFDAGQQVTWQIKSWSPTGDKATVVKTGTLALDDRGMGHSAALNLPNGHYKLYWNTSGKKGCKPKFKVFWVKCPHHSGKPTPTPSTSTPSTPPSSAPSPSTPGSSAGAPTPVQTNLPVTG